MKTVEEDVDSSHHVDERPAFWDTRQGEKKQSSTGTWVETRRNSAAKQSQTDEERLTTESSSQRNKSHTGSAFPKRQIVYDLTHHHRSFFEEKPEDETVREEERKRLIDAEERESIGKRETRNAD